MNWLIKKFLIGYVNDWLKKLPFDGWKTVVGVLLIVLAELLKAMPQHAPAIQALVDILNMIPSDPITDMGVVVLITGAVHKLLKFFERRK